MNTTLVRAFVLVARVIPDNSVIMAHGVCECVTSEKVCWRPVVVNPGGELVEGMCPRPACATRNGRYMRYIPVVTQSLTVCLKIHGNIDWKLICI